MQSTNEVSLNLCLGNTTNALNRLGASANKYIRAHVNQFKYYIIHITHEERLHSYSMGALRPQSVNSKLIIIIIIIIIIYLFARN